MEDLKTKESPILDALRWLQTLRLTSLAPNYLVEKVGNLK